MAKEPFQQTKAQIEAGKKVAGMSGDEIRANLAASANAADLSQPVIPPNVPILPGDENDQLLHLAHTANRDTPAIQAFLNRGEESSFGSSSAEDIQRHVVTKLTSGSSTIESSPLEPTPPPQAVPPRPEAAAPQATPAAPQAAAPEAAAPEAAAPQATPAAPSATPSHAPGAGPGFSSAADYHGLQGLGQAAGYAIGGMAGPLGSILGMAAGGLLGKAMGGGEVTAGEVGKTALAAAGGLVGGGAGKVLGALGGLLGGGGAEAGGEGGEGGGGAVTVSSGGLEGEPGEMVRLLREISMNIKSMVSDGLFVKGDHRRAGGSVI